MTRASRKHNPEDAVTVAEAARLLGVRHQAVYQAIKRGSLKTVTIYEPVRGIPRKELERYRESRSAAA